MKTFIGALALTLAIPAIAQTAPAADPHAQHKGMDHSQHGQGKHDCKDCCEKMKQQNGKMSCSDQKDGTKAAASATQHEGHAH